MITVCNGSMTPVHEYEYFRWHTACIGFLTFCSITSIIRIQNPSNLLIIITSLSQKQVDTHFSLVQKQFALWAVLDPTMTTQEEVGHQALR